MALVIDGNPTSRGVLVQHLRVFGYATIKQASRMVEAREILEHRPFDLVICDDHIGGDDESGLALLEELRREQLLPYSTVFVMVTGEATYQKVAEAAESALDSYLVKPFSGNTLLERVREARQRKRELEPVFEAIEAGDAERAAALCLSRFKQRQLYWLYAARLGAELLLDLKRPLEARRLFEAAWAARPMPWARLGLARAHLAEGKLAHARRALETLISEQPRYADAYDVMAKVQVEQGRLDEALATYRSASAVTPGCVLRLQHCGILSFHAGDTAAAMQMLERAWSLGSRSRLFDVLSMQLLAFMHFDARDGKALTAACEVMQRFAATYPQSQRLRRMAGVATALAHLLDGEVAPGLAQAQALAAEASRPDFDMEAATNTLLLWSRLAPYGVERADFRALVVIIARRFAVSKVTAEVLVAAVQRQEEASMWVHETQAEMLQLTEAAMSKAMRGEPRLAVEALLEEGRKTGNAKLIEMAAQVARRHRERIDDVQPLIEAATALGQRYGNAATHIAGIRRSSRPPGGLALRR
jgi:DNA-binding response OmpR family regulator